MNSGIDDLPDGRFLVWIDLGLQPDGRRPRHQARVEGKRKAQWELARLQREAAAGTLILTDRSVLSGALDLWLGAVKETVAPKTYERYADIVERHIKPGLGSIRLDRLQKNPEVIRGFLTDQRDHGGARGRPLAPRTVVHLQRVLHAALQWACDDGKLPSNPAAAPSVRKLVQAYASAAREEFQPTYLTAEQMRRVIEITRGTLLNLPVVLAVGAGMRRGEILALRWRDVDLEAGTVDVRHSLTQTREGVSEKQPKSRAGRRTIALPAFAINELRAARNARGEFAGPDACICCGSDGLAMKPDTFTSEFCGFIRQHKLQHVRFHDLRHSHATALIAGGVHAKTISARLGHSSSAFTLDTYMHAFEEVDRVAAAALDADFRSTFGQHPVNEGSTTRKQRHLRLVN